MTVRNLAIPKACWRFMPRTQCWRLPSSRQSSMTARAVYSGDIARFRPFFEEGARRLPNALVRWHRTGRWLTDGERLLVWEYPRQAPDGDQVDIVEVVEIAEGLIQCHRIYWG